MIGERRHETCRFGKLTEAWSTFESGHLSATVVPLCLWEMPERDCAYCRAWCGFTATAA